MDQRITLTANRKPRFAGTRRFFTFPHKTQTNLVLFWECKNPRRLAWVFLLDVVPPGLEPGTP